jgi:hypothetical protein
MTGAATLPPVEGAYAAPAALPPVTASTLDARYRATAQAVEKAEAVARQIGKTDRAKALDAMSRPGRQLLAFDPRGRGQAVEIIGDLATARRIAIVVPGADNDLETFDARADDPYSAPRGGAKALADAAKKVDADGDLAVIAWLGYDTPSTPSLAVATEGRAVDGGRELADLIATLRTMNPSAGISLLCHSYGSVVCAKSVADGAPVADLAVFGSPGTGVDRAADLGAERVWAGRGDDDWIRRVAGAGLKMFGLKLGFGTDPVARSFGARAFEVGDGGHSDYLRPGTKSLHNLALIALGQRT